MTDQFPPPPPTGAVPSSTSSPPMEWNPPSAAAGQARQDRPTQARAERGPSWWQRRKVVVASRVLAVLALVGTGFAAGWWVASDRDAIAVADAPATSAAGDREVATDATSMPDLRGLAAADARTILADNGVPTANVTIEEVPAAGESGLVTAQSPAFGYPLDGPIVLRVSTRAVVPEIKGVAAEDLFSQLDDLGAQVANQSRFKVGATPGSVIAIEPASGQPLADTVVTVTVAAAASTLPLSSVASLESACSTDEATINGTAYVDAFTCSVGTDVEVQSWSINRAAARLSGTLGIDDEADDGYRSAVRVSVVGIGRDGKQTVLAAGTLSHLGKPLVVDADLSGVLQLKITVSATSEDQYGYLALGDLTLLGDAAALEALSTD